MKTTIALLALFILVLGGGYAVYTHSQTTALQNPVTSVASTTDTGSSAAPTTGSPGSSAGGTPVTPATPAPGTYTSAQIAMHNTSGNCWTSINGNVYDLTNWIGQHPGGEAAILSICGKDGTSAFEGQHGRPGDTRPQQMLATFKIGALASS